MEKLKKLRLEKNYSCEYVAEHIGISKPHYWQLERGSKRLTYEMAVKIANFFKTTPDYLFYEEFKKLLNI